MLEDLVRHRDELFHTGQTLPRELHIFALRSGLSDLRLIEHLLALLSRNTDAGIPPSLVKALKRWEVNGTEARVQAQVILKVSKPEILDEMRKSKAAKFLGEVLSPTTVIVKSGAIPKVMEALTELGLLAEIADD